MFSGRASEGIAPLEYGLRLSPYDSQNFVWFNTLALARLFSGRAEAGLEAAARALQLRPNWWTSLEVLTCCYAALRKWDEARRCAQQMASVTKRPGDVFAPLKAHNPVWTEQITTAPSLPTMLVQGFGITVTTLRPVRRSQIVQKCRNIGWSGPRDFSCIASDRLNKGRTAADIEANKVFWRD